jgi:hypothetical protein
MYIINWDPNQILSNAVWTKIYEYNYPGSVLHWYGCIFQLDSNDILFRITANDILMVDVDLSELNDSNKFDLSTDSPRWIRPYSEKRWSIEPPQEIRCDRIVIEMKSKAVTQCKMVRGFSSHMGLGG